MRLFTRAFFIAAATWAATCWADAPRRILVIPQEINTPFWISLRTGAERAAREFTSHGTPVQILWQGSAKPSDLAAQIRLVESARPDQVDGILLAPVDRQELVEPAEAAVQRGVPVLTVEAGLDSRKIPTCIGDLNFEAGRMAASCLAAALGGRGNVLLFRHHINAEDTEQREQGFLEVMRNDFPAIRLLVTDFHAGPTRAIAERVVPSLIGKYAGSLNGIFTSSECAGASVVSELARRGLQGKVAYVGIEDEGGVLRPALASGLVQGLVTRDAEALGYQAVRTLVEKLNGLPRTPPAEISLRTLAPDGSAGPAPASFDPRQIVAAGKGILVVPSAGIVMVAIPPGSFDMGSTPDDRGFRDSDSPPTRVTLSRVFWLGKYELTQREWVRLMGSNPSDFVGETQPVDNISWNDATDYCRRLNAAEKAAGRLPDGYAYQLPTEAQWEYACRAGTTAARAGNLDDMGWYVGNSGSWAPPDGPVSRSPAAVWQMSTHPVGQKLPNTWGLYDMYGNVLEWCRDLYGPYSPGRVTDPAGATTGTARVARGGGWWTDPEVCFSFSRTKAPPTRHHNALGMRVALAPSP